MISETFDLYSNYTSEIIEWIDEQYSLQFSEYFDIQHTLYQRFSDGSRPITDSELEQILVDIPLKLFSASERLASIQASIEAIKLKIKRDEHTIADKHGDLSDTKRKELASISTTDDKIVLSAYNSLVSRIEREMSYSRELVMGAKKIWDARRRTESSNPIKETDTSSYDSLPDYVPKSQTYIK